MNDGGESLYEYGASLTEKYEAAMKELTFYRTTAKGEMRQAIARLERERDAARADAARMRLLVERFTAPMSVTATIALEQEARDALAPDDGWLARHDAEVADKAIRVAVAESKEQCWHCGAPQAEQLARRIEEAVEPYREALRDILYYGESIPLGMGEAEYNTGAIRDMKRTAGRALLGGTPTKEGE